VFYLVIVSPPCPKIIKLLKRRTKPFCGTYRSMERGSEGEYGGNTPCTNRKMRPVETIPGVGRGRIRRTVERVNSTMRYCKKLCKCHNVPHPAQQ
jgi:hypothetical protein